VLCLQIGISVDRSEGKAIAEVSLGNTRVVAVVTATVTAPFPDRPAEGFLSFNVNTSPMSGPSYDVRSPELCSLAKGPHM
jgi:exosome complex RNA-binding protein Rrp42 (RNase PH superfamily)